MSSLRICPVCGANLPGDAPRGLCPRCLFGQAIGVPHPDSVQSPESASDKPRAGVQRAVQSSARQGPATRAPDVQRFGDYELFGELAEGGMGAVYYARQISLNRFVALKMIRSGQLATAAEVQRFRTEAEAAGNLDHPNIVPIYEIGQHEGQNYFSMKLIEGGTLADLIAEWKTGNGDRKSVTGAQAANPGLDHPSSACGYPPSLADHESRSAYLMATIARAVHHAHQRGVLHRDLKPTNILLDERGEPHLTDFGLAKLVLDRPNFTQSLAVLGTPGYMAPEQAAGRAKQLTTAVDIYSLGAILYELLTGMAPFKGDSTLEILKQVQEQEPEHPIRLNPHVDRDLATICLKCLEKEPQRRYATAEEMARDLDRWHRGEPIHARTSTHWERAVKWARRKPAVASLAAAAVLILLAGLVGVFWEWRQARAEARRAEFSARETRERLVRSHVANGTRLLDEGNPFDALVWFAEALRLDAGDPAQEAGHRLRLATVLRHSPKLLQILRAGAHLSSADFSSDGKRVVTAGKDGKAWVFDVESGAQVLGLLQHGRDLTLASFVEQDQAILTWSYGGDGARIWDAHTGRLLRFLGHKGMLWAKLSADKRWLLTNGAVDGEGNIKLWDAHSGELMLPVLRHGEVAVSSMFFPDGNRFVTASSDTSMIIWDRASMKPLFPPMQLNGEAGWLAVSPDGSRVAAGNWLQSVQIWDAATGRPIVAPLPHKDSSKFLDIVGFSPNGKWLVSLSQQGPAAVKLWGAQSGQFLRDLSQSSAPNDIDFASDSKCLAVACADGTVYLWDLTTDPPASVQLKHGQTVVFVASNRDGRRLLAAGSDGTIRLWERNPVDASSAFTVEGQAVLEVTARRLLTRNSEGAAQLWDANTWKPVDFPIPISNALVKAWLSQDGSRLVTLCGDSNLPPANVAAGRFASADPPLPTPRLSTDLEAQPPADKSPGIGGLLELRAWEPASARLLSSMNIRLEGEYGVWASPDVGRVAISQSNRVAFRDVVTGKPLWEGQAGTASIRRVVFHPTAPRAALLTPRQVHVLDTTTGQIVFSPLGFTANPSCAAFSPNGRWLAIGSGDPIRVEGDARIWDAEIGRALTPAMKHQDAILGLFFSPDNQRLATVSRDQTARIWDPQTGQALTAPLLHGAAVNYAAFSPDSRWLATFSDDGTARLWEVRNGEPLTPALKHPRSLITGGFLAGTKYLFAQDASGAMTRWELPQDRRPVQDWVSLASLLAARQISSAGLLESLNAGAISNAWKTLRSRYPGDFRPGAL